MNLEELTKQFLSAQEQECEFSAIRKSLGRQIAEILSTKSEGTDSQTVGPYKISVINKLTRQLDYEAYRQYEESIPEGVRPVIYKPEIDLKKLRALEMVDANLPAMFITTKPAAPQIKIQEA